MLTTSTGIAMGDSGGGDGRHWQRNQKKTERDFENEDAVWLDFDAPCKSDDIGITVSLYHYLPSVLELDDICDAYNALPQKDWECEDAYGVSKRGEKFLRSAGFDFGDAWNTYNGENNLSQTLQGCNLKRDGLGEGDYVLIQVHNGADVRGGYTDAKLFKMQAFQEYLNPTPYVTATLTRTDNTSVDLDMRESGYGFTDTNGEAVDILEGDTITATLV